MGYDINNFINNKTFKTHLKSFYYNEIYKIKFVIDMDIERIKTVKRNYQKLKIISVHLN